MSFFPVILPYPQCLAIPFWANFNYLKCISNHFFLYFFVRSDLLVGVHVDGYRINLVHGGFHQVLRCAHTQFESEKASGRSYSGHVTATCGHTSTQGKNFKLATIKSFYSRYTTTFSFCLSIGTCSYRDIVRHSRVDEMVLIQIIRAVTDLTAFRCKQQALLQTLRCMALEHRINNHNWWSLCHPKVLGVRTNHHPRTPVSPALPESPKILVHRHRPLHPARNNHLHCHHLDRKINN